METTLAAAPPAVATDPDFLLRTALDVAVQTLRAGGEVRRVEETVERICYAYGASHVEVFAISTHVVASIRMKNGTYSSQTRRIFTINNHMARLCRLNEISRALCNREMTLEEAQKEVASAKRIVPYPPVYEYIGAFVCSGGFAIMFGGCWRDAVAAAAISFLVALIMHYLPQSVNLYVSLALVNFIGGLCSVFAVRLGLADDVGYIVIGVIMPLVPGLTFGNSLRDLFLGDLLTGVLGLMRTLLIALSIAFGLFLSTAVTGGLA